MIEDDEKWHARKDYYCGSLRKEVGKSKRGMGDSAYCVLWKDLMNSFLNVPFSATGGDDT